MRRRQQHPGGTGEAERAGGEREERGNQEHGEAARGAARRSAAQRVRHGEDREGEEIGEERWHGVRIQIGRTHSQAGMVAKIVTIRRAQRGLRRRRAPPPPMARRLPPALATSARHYPKRWMMPSGRQVVFQMCFGRSACPSLVLARSSKKKRRRRACRERRPVHQL